MTATKTERLDDVMAQIEALGYGTPEYHEAMWFLLSIMARRQFAIADQLRRDRRKRERAAATRATNRAARDAARSRGCGRIDHHAAHDWYGRDDEEQSCRYWCLGHVVMEGGATAGRDFEAVTS